jgi:hypothetical protein
MNKVRTAWCWRTAPALALLLAGWVGSAQAQNGGGAVDPAKLLEQLKTLEETVTKARTGNNLAALDAITEAAAADSKAIALWIDSVRETDFRDQDKKEAEFRAWREGAGRRLSEPGAAGALRLHLQYLLLTIRVASATSDQDRAEVLTSLLAYLDDLSRADKATLKNRQALDTSVLATPIARRYKLDITVRPPEAWSLTPGNLEAIYESSILPYLRQKKDAARLQTAWSRRLQQEAALVATQDSEVLTKNYREVVLPTLEWAQARDLFIAGAPGAGAKMLQLIQQNQGHKNTPVWIQELRSLLTGGELGGDTGAAAAGPRAGTTPPEAPDEEPAAEADAPPVKAPVTPPAKPRGPATTFPPNLNR